MSGRTVLVVDDNRDELMIYSTLLSHRGYAVLAASDYDAALQLARQHRPALALIDVNLNDALRDGTDLIRALRELDTTSEIPIVAHTAFGDIYGNRLDAVGCDVVLHKPTNPNQLLQTVESLAGAPEA